jgi:hypothetical protein
MGWRPRKVRICFTLWPHRRCGEYILLSPGFPAVPEMLVSLASALLVYREAGQNCSGWNPDFGIKQSITVVAAPLGFGSKAPSLVDLSEEQIMLIHSRGPDGVNPIHRSES